MTENILEFWYSPVSDIEASLNSLSAISDKNFVLVYKFWIWCKLSQYIHYKLLISKRKNTLYYLLLPIYSNHINHIILAEYIFLRAMIPYPFSCIREKFIVSSKLWFPIFQIRSLSSHQNHYNDFKHYITSLLACMALVNLE